MYFFTINTLSFCAYFLTILRVFLHHFTCTSSHSRLRLHNASSPINLYFFTIQPVFLHHSTCISSPFYVHFFSNLRVLLPNFNCISSLSCMYFFTILLYFSTTLCVFPHHSTYVYSIGIRSPFYAIFGAV